MSGKRESLVQAYLLRVGPATAGLAQKKRKRTLIDSASFSTVNLLYNSIFHDFLSSNARNQSVERLLEETRRSLFRGDDQKQAQMLHALKMR